jgi:hypothetical protein
MLELTRVLICTKNPPFNAITLAAIEESEAMLRGEKSRTSSTIPLMQRGRTLVFRF